MGCNRPLYISNILISLPFPGVEAKLTVFTVEVEAVATALEAIKAQEAEAVVAFNLEGLKLQRKSL